MHILVKFSWNSFVRQIKTPLHLCEGDNFQAVNLLDAGGTRALFSSRLFSSRETVREHYLQPYDMQNMCNCQSFIRKND